MFNRKLLDGNNPLFDKAVFRFFDGVNEIGKQISPNVVREAIHKKMSDYVMEVAPGYQVAQPLLGSVAEEKAFYAYKKKRFLETAKPCDVILVRGNQRISRIIRTLTQSPYSHAAFYIGNGKMVEADPKGVLVTSIDKYIQLDLRICRPTMLGPKGKNRVLKHINQMVKTQPKYDLDNIEKLFFKYWYNKIRPDIKVYIGGDTKFEKFYICSGMIAHGFHMANYPIIPSLRFKKNSKRVVDKIRSVEDYVRVISHLKKNYSQIVPGDFDQSPFFSSIKFLYLDTKYTATKRQFLVDHEDDPEVSGIETE